MEGQPQIQFFFESAKAPLFDEGPARHWVADVIRREGKMPGVLQFIFCDDEYLMSINKKYLQHDEYTDIITFDYSEEYPQGVSGDIFISYTRVRDNARLYDVTDLEETYRVMVHGVLHLLGYDDGDDEARELMQAKENYYLSLIP